MKLDDQKLSPNHPVSFPGNPVHVNYTILIASLFTLKKENVTTELEGFSNIQLTVVCSDSTSFCDSYQEVFDSNPALPHLLIETYTLHRLTRRFLKTIRRRLHFSKIIEDSGMKVPEVII